MNNQNSGSYVRRHPERLKCRRQGHLVALLASLLLVLGAAVGGTLAFIMTASEEKTNTFTPAQISCDVMEEFDGTVKRNAAVKNTGGTEAYIRAAVNVTWMKDENASGQTITAKVPQADVDYELIFHTDTGWIKGADGYWYYQTPVAPGAVTAAFVRECRQLEGANVPQGYHLSVEIVASAIQSSPEKAVTQQWNVTLEGNKIVSANGNEVTGE